MTAEELKEKEVLSVDGEVVGEVEDLGYNETTGEKVARIDVGGLLGIGKKRIALPLSELTVIDDGQIQSTLTRDEIASEPEIGDEIVDEIDE